MMGKIEPEEVTDSGDDYVQKPKQKPYVIVFILWADVCNDVQQ